MTRSERSAYRALSALALLSCIGCGDSGGSGIDGSAVNGTGGDGQGARNGSGSTNGTGSTNGSAAGSGSGSTNGSGSANGSGGIVINVGGSSENGGSSNVGDGTPETCDGVDNDSNGIIDDVDAGGDGVCDCLNIATIGNIGPWSNGGNIFEAWLDARSPIGAVALADEELTAEKLKKFQIIVVLHAAPVKIESNGVVAPALHVFSDGEAGAFEAWVRGGGGVMTTIGYTGDEASEVTNVNKLLGKLGMGYSASKLDLSGDVKGWMPHAVTEGISNIHTNNGVEPDAAGGMTIATGGDGRIALQVAQVDDGRVAVWGDEWVTYDSEWADVDGQQVEHFWLNLLKWLSPPSECQVPIPPRVK
jgi:hypothetical protein